MDSLGRDRQDERRNRNSMDISSSSPSSPSALQLCSLIRLLTLSEICWTHATIIHTKQSEGAHEANHARIHDNDPVVPDSVSAELESSITDAFDSLSNSFTESANAASFASLASLPLFVITAATKSNAHADASTSISQPIPSSLPTSSPHGKSHQRHLWCFFLQTRTTETNAKQFSANVSDELFKRFAASPTSATLRATHMDRSGVIRFDSATGEPSLVQQLHGASGKQPPVRTLLMLLDKALQAYIHKTFSPQLPLLHKFDFHFTVRQSTLCVSFMPKVRNSVKASSSSASQYTSSSLDRAASSLLILSPSIDLGRVFASRSDALFELMFATRKACTGVWQSANLLDKALNALGTAALSDFLNQTSGSNAALSSLSSSSPSTFPLVFWLLLMAIRSGMISRKQLVRFAPQLEPFWIQAATQRRTIRLNRLQQQQHSQLSQSGIEHQRQLSHSVSAPGGLDLPRFDPSLALLSSYSPSIPSPQPPQRSPNPPSFTNHLTVPLTSSSAGPLSMDTLTVPHSMSMRPHSLLPAQQQASPSPMPIAASTTGAGGITASFSDSLSLVPPMHYEPSAKRPKLDTADPMSFEIPLSMFLPSESPSSAVSASSGLEIGAHESESLRRSREFVEKFLPPLTQYSSSLPASSSSTIASHDATSNARLEKYHSAYPTRLHFPSIFSAQLAALTLQFNDSPARTASQSISNIRAIPPEFKRKHAPPGAQQGGGTHAAAGIQLNTIQQPPASSSTPRGPTTSALAMRASVTQQTQQQPQQQINSASSPVPTNLATTAATSSSTTTNEVARKSPQIVVDITTPPSKSSHAHGKSLDSSMSSPTAHAGTSTPTPAGTSNAAAGTTAATNAGGHAASTSAAANPFGPYRPYIPSNAALLRFPTIYPPTKEQIAQHFLIPVVESDIRIKEEDPTTMKKREKQLKRKRSPSPMQSSVAPSVFNPSPAASSVAQSGLESGVSPLVEWSELPPAPFCFFPFNDEGADLGFRNRKEFNGSDRSTGLATLRKKQSRSRASSDSSDSSDSDSSDSSSDSSDDESSGSRALKVNLDKAFIEVKKEHVPAPNVSFFNAPTFVEIPAYMCKFIQQQALAPLIPFDVPFSYSASTASSSIRQQSGNLFTYNSPFVESSMGSSTEESLNRTSMEILQLTALLKKAFHLNPQQQLLPAQMSMTTSTSPSSDASPALNILPSESVPRILLSFEDTPGHDELRSFPIGITHYFDRAGIKPFNPSLPGAFEFEQQAMKQLKVSSTTTAVANSNASANASKDREGRISFFSSASSTSMLKNALFVVVPPPQLFLSSSSSDIGSYNKLDTYFTNLSIMYDQCRFGRHLNLLQFSQISNAASSSAATVAFPPRISCVLDLKYLKPKWLQEASSSSARAANFGRNPSPSASPVLQPSAQLEAELANGISHLPALAATAAATQESSPNPSAMHGSNTSGSTSSGSGSGKNDMNLFGSVLLHRMEQTFPKLLAVHPPTIGMHRFYQSMIWNILQALCRIVRNKELAGSASGSGQLHTTAQPQGNQHAMPTTGASGVSSSSGASSSTSSGGAAALAAAKQAATQPLDFDRFDSLVIYIACCNEDESVRHSLPLLSHYLSYLTDSNKFLAEVTYLQDMQQKRFASEFSIDLNSSQLQQQLSSPIGPSSPDRSAVAGTPVPLDYELLFTESEKDLWLNALTCLEQLNVCIQFVPTSTTSSNLNVSTLRQQCCNVYTSMMRNNQRVALFWNELTNLAANVGISHGGALTRITKNGKPNAANSQLLSLAFELPPFPNWVEPIAILERAPKLPFPSFLPVRETSPIPFSIEDLFNMNENDTMMDEIAIPAMNTNIQMMVEKPRSVSPSDFLNLTDENTFTPMQPPLPVIPSPNQTSNIPILSKDDTTYTLHVSYLFVKHLGCLLAVITDERGAIIHPVLLSVNESMIAELSASSVNASAPSAPPLQRIYARLLSKLMRDHLKPLLMLLPRSLFVSQVRLVLTSIDAIRTVDRDDVEGGLEREAWNEVACEMGWKGCWSNEFGELKHPASCCCHETTLSPTFSPIIFPRGSAEIVDVMFLSARSSMTPPMVRAASATILQPQSAPFMPSANGVMASSSSSSTSSSAMVDVDVRTDGIQQRPVVAEGELEFDTEIERAKQLLNATVTSKSWWHTRALAVASATTTTSTSSGSLGSVNLHDGFGVRASSVAIGSHTAVGVTIESGIGRGVGTMSITQYYLPSSISSIVSASSQRISAKTLSLQGSRSQDTSLGAIQCTVRGYFVPFAINSSTASTSASIGAAVCPSHSAQAKSIEVMSPASYLNASLEQVLLQWKCLAALHTPDIDPDLHRMMHHGRSKRPNKQHSSSSSGSGEPILFLPIHLTVLTRLHSMVNAI